MREEINTEQNMQNGLECRVCSLEQRVKSLETDKKDKKKLTVKAFGELWKKNPKALAQGALTDESSSMRHPRFVLESKLLRATFWMMIATFAMVIATVMMVAITFFRADDIRKEPQPLSNMLRGNKSPSSLSIFRGSEASVSSGYKHRLQRRG